MTIESRCGLRGVRVGEASNLGLARTREEDEAVLTEAAVTRIGGGMVS